MSAIQECTKVNYDYRNQNGAGIWLPPNVLPGLNNLKRIDPYESTAEQLYPTGAIGFRDQRKFAYSHCTGALAGWARLVIDSNYIPSATSHTDEDGFEGGTYAAALIDAEYVDIADTSVARAKNYYEGGLFVAFNVDAVRTTAIRIAASDATVDSTYVRIYLDDPLPFALAAGETGGWCNAYRSPYSNVTEHSGTNNGFESFVGLSLIDVTAGHWSWLQIAGPAWIAQQGNDIPGYAAYKRDAWAHPDGTCTICPATSFTEDFLQYIGYALGMHVNTKGDTYIMLKLG